MSMAGIPGSSHRVTAAFEQHSPMTIQAKRGLVQRYDQIADDYHWPFNPRRGFRRQVLVFVRLSDAHAVDSSIIRFIHENKATDVRLK